MLTPDQPGYVVVSFGGKADGWCTLSHCPQGSVTWFPTREEAEAYSDTLPAGFQPHILAVERGARFAGMVWAGIPRPWWQAPGTTESAPPESP